MKRRKTQSDGLIILFLFAGHIGALAAFLLFGG